MKLPASRTIHGLIAVLIGVILTWLGIAVPEEDIGETVTLVLMVIGGIAQVYGIIRSWAARYERGDVTLTGKKTALTKVEVIPVDPTPTEGSAL
jgi:hypothetical protein